MVPNLRYCHCLKDPKHSLKLQIFKIKRKSNQNIWVYGPKLFTLYMTLHGSFQYISNENIQICRCVGIRNFSQLAIFPSVFLRFGGRACHSNPGTSLWSCPFCSDLANKPGLVESEITSIESENLITYYEILRVYLFEVSFQKLR